MTTVSTVLCAAAKSTKIVKKYARETHVLGVPGVTLNDNNERPETAEAGSNVFAGADSDRIVECAKMMVLRENVWVEPFGEGEIGRKTVEELERTGIFGT